MKKKKIRKQAKFYTNLITDRIKKSRDYLNDASGRSKHVRHFRDIFFALEDDLNKLIRTLEQDDE